MSDRMRFIHKFPVGRVFSFPQQVDVPGYCEFLDIQPQGDAFALWAVCLTPSAEVVRLTVRLWPSGHHPLPQDLSFRSYRRTMQTPDGLVWHAFITEGNPS